MLEWWVSDFFADPPLKKLMKIKPRLSGISQYSHVELPATIQFQRKLKFHDKKFCLTLTNQVINVVKY